MVDDRKFIEALLLLRHNSAFEEVVSNLKNRRQLAADECVQHIDHPKLLRSQGRFKALDEFIYEVENAETRFEKLSKNK